MLKVKLQKKMQSTTAFSFNNLTLSAFLPAFLISSDSRFVSIINERKESNVRLPPFEQFLLPFSIHPNPFVLIFKANCCCRSLFVLVGIIIICSRHSSSACSFDRFLSCLSRLFLSPRFCWNNHINMWFNSIRLSLVAVMLWYIGWIKEGGGR